MKTCSFRDRFLRPWVLIWISLDINLVFCRVKNVDTRHVYARENTGMSLFITGQTEVDIGRVHKEALKRWRHLGSSYTSAVKSVNILISPS